MSYDAQEISVQSGAPVELYEFVYGAQALYYTSSSRDYTDTGGTSMASADITYTSASIDRSTIASSPEQARNTIKLTVPRTFPIADLFRVTPPSDEIALTIRRFHRGETSSVAIPWIGRVIGNTFIGARAELQCEPITVSLKRTGLRRLYSKNCTHVLYGPACGLTKTDWDHATTVADIDGSDLEVASVGTGSYAGGWVEWVDGDGNTERRFIESQTGVVLTLMQPFAGIAVSDSVTLFLGCDHTLTTCNGTFSNAANYGGFPFIPSRNPFNGSPVF